MYCESPYNLNFDSEILSRFSWNLTDSIENRGSDEVSAAVEQPLALAGQKGRVKMNGDNATRRRTRVSEPKTMAALKSHSDAERRRRERINAHLETLRGLVPTKEKIDKATLLAEVIKQVKQLKTIARQDAVGFLIPMDTDDVNVEILESNKNGPFLLRASLCCDQSPELLSDLRKAVNDIHVRVVKCEVSTLDRRVKIAFLITSATTTEGNSDDGMANWDVIANNFRAAMCNILDKISASAEFAQPLSFPRKRQRGSYISTTS